MLYLSVVPKSNIGKDNTSSYVGQSETGLFSWFRNLCKYEKKKPRFMFLVLSSEFTCSSFKKKKKENGTVLPRAAPKGSVKSHPKDYHQKLTY